MTYYVVRKVLEDPDETLIIDFGLHINLFKARYQYKTVVMRNGDQKEALIPRIRTLGMREYQNGNFEIMASFKIPDTSGVIRLEKWTID